MKDQSGKQRHFKKRGSQDNFKMHKIAHCQRKGAVGPTEPLRYMSPLPEHLIDYNDIVVQLIKRKAQYLSPYENNSSYEEWARTQDKIALYQSSSDSMEAILKARIKLTRQKFIENMNWKTLDIINYLISSHSDVSPLPSAEPSMREDITSLQRNPIVLTASPKETSSKSGHNDVSKPAGSRKAASKKPTSAKKVGLAPVPSLSEKEPAYPKKYKPTYNLSNYDYVKKGWTKLPDYSITYKYYTLGTEPAFPALWAFRSRTDGRKDFYPNTTYPAADFEGEKPYYIFYPNGEIAISISEGRVGPRLIVYSMSRRDDSGRWIESRPQAMFDSKGNGVVYDLDGRIRMNYDQIEGAMYSYGKNARPVLHWYWKESTFLRVRRDDLQAVPADHNDDIDPNKPERVSLKSGSSKRSKKKKSRKRASEVKRKSKTPRKSKAPRKSKTPRKSRTPRKSETGRKSKTARKSKTPRKNKVTMKEEGTIKSKSGKKVKSEEGGTPRMSQTAGTKTRSARKSIKKFGGTTKRATRVDIPPLRKKPRRPKPITEIAPLAIKITDYVSMRIMSQQHIHLDFECASIHYRLYLGVNVKPETVERIDKIVNPKRVENITPCYFELMPLRSHSLYKMNKRLQDMRREAARREYKKTIRSLGGFYAWWLKKKRAAFEKRQNQHFLIPLGPNKMA